MKNPSTFLFFFLILNYQTAQSGDPGRTQAWNLTIDDVRPNVSQDASVPQRSPFNPVPIRSGE